MKLIKPFRGVPAGEIYPRDFKAGEVCPPELLEAARQADAVEQEKKPAAARATSKE